MLPKLRLALLNRETQSQPAQLKHYRRFKVKGQTYPGLILAHGDRVDGCVLQGLSDEELLKLDDYEGEEYTRIVVEVEINSALQKVYTYLFTPSNSNRMTREPWSLDSIQNKPMGEDWF